MCVCVGGGGGGGEGGVSVYCLAGNLLLIDLQELVCIYMKVWWLLVSFRSTIILWLWYIKLGYITEIYEEVLISQY